MNINFTLFEDFMYSPTHNYTHARLRTSTETADVDYIMNHRHFSHTSLLYHINVQVSHIQSPVQS